QRGGDPGHGGGWRRGETGSRARPSPSPASASSGAFLGFGHVMLMSVTQRAYHGCRRPSGGGVGVGGGGMSDPAHDRDEVELRLALVLGRYGDRLDADQVQGLRRTLEALVEHVTALSAVPL